MIEENAHDPDKIGYLVRLCPAEPKLRMQPFLFHDYLKNSMQSPIIKQCTSIFYAHPLKLHAEIDLQPTDGYNQWINSLIEKMFPVTLDLTFEVCLLKKKKKQLSCFPFSP